MWHLTELEVLRNIQSLAKRAISDFANGNFQKACNSVLTILGITNTRIEEIEKERDEEAKEKEEQDGRVDGKK